MCQIPILSSGNKQSIKYIVLKYIMRNKVHRKELEPVLDVKYITHWLHTIALMSRLQLQHFTCQKYWLFQKIIIQCLKWAFIHASTPKNKNKKIINLIYDWGKKSKSVPKNRNLPHLPYAVIDASNYQSGKL